MTIGTIFGAIIIGAIIGALGRLFLPGRQPIGWILTIVVGIVAALIGTAIAQVMGVATTPGIDWIELVMQVVLAVIGVSIVAGIRGRSRA
ncbi:GlsB/YeaQ/YmgE family stress response membrane protein [Sphaerimonospora sp. CA-214678]|uniref:GlsB/YeaQ/YmgE family stress response membrane protein n=1 Tax=Sphaerimonospora sp. CA-214678 TaxID=3240029 RepID=UPI003D8D9FA4